MSLLLGINSNYINASDVDEKKLESGDQGEEKTFKYEVEKLKKLDINKEPIWESFYDNFLGYDIQSWFK